MNSIPQESEWAGCGVLRDLWLQIRGVRLIYLREDWEDVVSPAGITEADVVIHSCMAEVHMMVSPL
jgi:hypothetical protein